MTTRSSPAWTTPTPTRPSPATTTSCRGSRPPTEATSQSVFIYVVYTEVPGCLLRPQPSQCSPSVKNALVSAEVPLYLLRPQPSPCSSSVKNALVYAEISGYLLRPQPSPCSPSVKKCCSLCRGSRLHFEARAQPVLFPHLTYSTPNYLAYGFYALVYADVSGYTY